MWISIRITSKRPVFQAATAAAPSATTSRDKPTDAMMVLSTFWLVGLSSAARRRRGGQASSSAKRSSSLTECSAVSARRMGAAKRKVEPRPSALSKLIRPPIMRASSAEMARPRPEPPKRRVAELST